MKETTFESSNGRDRIHAYLWEPEGQPVGVIQLIHGMQEHMGRYSDFAKFLNEKGFVVVGHDQLGHGKSIADPADTGFFAEKNGWDTAVQDIRILHNKTAEKFPGKPFFLFGHSMGSFLARTYLIYFRTGLDGAVISGTGQQGKALVFAGWAASELMVKTKGARADGQQLNDMAFGSYCKRIPDARTPFDWLSRDPENVDKYIADPLCGFVAKVSLYRDMMSGIRFISNQKNVDKMNKEAPIYFMSGEEDPVGDYGVGVNKAYKAFLAAGLKDVMIRLYPGGRHEMFNETNRADVYDDILNWLNEKLLKIK
jgi:alpha-beta hydrolase superfamily lysophospholipase